VATSSNPHIDFRLASIRTESRNTISVRNMAGNAAMPSGYDYELVVKVPDEYICTICHLTMKKPVQTKCGHRFCKACLDEYNKRSDY